VLLDHHEDSLWELQRAFGDRGPSVELQLADVRAGSRLGQVLRRARPEVIFHLAAFKHVPFAEVFAEEVVAVNVLGTKLLLELAAELGVERFVYPSSDKSCQPPSLYGATKRLAELLVRDAARRTGQPYNVVRFVNILGTQGSVIEVFARQSAAGGPLTVTDPAMTRYWIGMEEALWLLLSAGVLPDGGRTLMLDAGGEVPVVEMAGRIWSLVRGEPAVSAPISFGSARPGERLQEVLLSASERFEPGPVAGLLEVRDAQSERHLTRIDSLVAGLLDRLERGDSDALRAAAMAAAEELQ
jgi:FlaA1/EpsC-like NDP-sugar epimerase